MPIWSSSRHFASACAKRHYTNRKWRNKPINSLIFYARVHFIKAAKFSQDAVPKGCAQIIEF